VLFESIFFRFLTGGNVGISCEFGLVEGNFSVFLAVRLLGLVLCGKMFDLVVPLQ
jgi:hypothetical protein